MAVSDHARVFGATALLKGGRSFGVSSEYRSIHSHRWQCLRRSIRQQRPLTVTSVNYDFNDLLAAADESRPRKSAA
jgi:hypothetical protein